MNSKGAHAGARKRALLIGIPILLAIGIAFVIVAQGRGGREPLAATGTVEATETALGFTVAGRLATIAVDEGDTVTMGNAIASLDRSETMARADQSRAQVLAARAALLELERGSRPEEIAAARAASQMAASVVADAERQAERARALKASEVISQQELDQAVTALDVAKSRLKQAQEEERLVRVGPRAERIASARAQLASAEAAERALEATLSQMEVRAPFSGVVTVRHHEPGEILPAGTPVLTLLNRNDRWVRIYVPEQRIGTVQIGQKANVTTDTFRNKRYAGQVTAIASEAEFTPKTVQTREERVKLVYAVKVRITGDPANDLKPGMPADVTLVDTRP